MSPYSNSKSYDSESLNGLKGAFDVACAALGISASSPAEIRDALAKHVLSVAAGGESEMKLIAERAVALMLDEQA